MVQLAVCWGFALTARRTMVERTISTDTYQLFPSPRNRHRELFAFEVFVPYPYALIDLSGFPLKGKSSLFAASRNADRKQGQLVSFELEADRDTFVARFVPD